MGLFGRALVALATLTLAGCSLVASGEQSSGSPASSPAAGANVVALSSVWPHVPVRAWSSSAWGEVAATPDGATAVGEALAASPPHAPVGPATMDRKTGHVTVIRSFSNPRTQVVSIVADSDWVAWIEGSTQPSFVDWILYSYDRHTGQIRTLAAAPKPYPYTPIITISMSSGVVVWSAVEAPDGIFHVYAVKANGGNLRVLASNAKGPQIVWPWVVYDVKPTGSGLSASLARQNLETGDVQQISGPVDVSYFAYDGEGLAWISKDTTDIYLQPTVVSAPVHIYSGRYLQFVSINSRLVGWGQDKGALVYDRKLKAVVQLSNLYDFYPVMSDHALDWLFQPNANPTNPYKDTVWREVDLSDLP
jgi:hypothetical protein